MRSLRLSIILFVAAFGGAASALATEPTEPNCNIEVGNDDQGRCDISATVVQVVPAPPSVAFSNGTQTNYVKYTVTLTHYEVRREGFSQVTFSADTSVANASSPGPANFVSVSAAAIANAGSSVLLNPATACVIALADPKHIDCVFNFNPPFDNPVGNSAQATITFDVSVQSPTGSPAAGYPPPTLNVKSKTSWIEALGQPEPEFYELTSTTNLTVPDPAVVATYLPLPGTVTTGTNQGAATPAQPWVTIVKVPSAGQVGVDLTDNTEQCPPGTCDFFSKIAIPGQHFGIGTHWYDHDAKSKLLVITLRKEVTTVDGPSDPVKRALQILKERIYYKPDGGQFQQVLLCIVTSGPTPGNPCIAYAQVYTKFNLPNVSNKSEYLGDHEWVIFANENGKYAQ